MGDAAVDATPTVTVTPAPSEAEMAAILAAYSELWPRPVVADNGPQTPKWRFSGRWWSPFRGAGAPRH